MAAALFTPGPCLFQNGSKSFLPESGSVLFPYWLQNDCKSSLRESFLTESSDEHVTVGPCFRVASFPCSRTRFQLRSGLWGSPGVYPTCHFCTVKHSASCIFQCLCVVSVFDAWLRGFCVDDMILPVHACATRRLLAVQAAWGEILI